MVEHIQMGGGVGWEGGGGGGQQQVIGGARGGGYRRRCLPMYPPGGRS